MTSSRPSPEWLAPLAVGLVAAGFTWLRWIDPTTWNVVDLVDFVQGGRSVLEGTDIYGVYPGVLAFNYPPFGALVCVPLGLLGVLGSTWLMTALSVASYILIVRVSLGRSGWAGSSRAQWWWTGALLVLGLALEPVQRTLIFGQVNLVLVALVLLDIFVVPRRARGLLLGVAAGIKITPAFFGLYYLVKREWASAVRSLTSGLATVVLGWLLLPSASADYWLGGLDKLSRFGTDALQPANQSLRAVWVRLLGGEPGLGYPLSAAAVALLAAYACHRLVAAGEDLAAVTVVAAGSLLVSPISWTHHWVWVVPALVVMVRLGARMWPVLVCLLMFLPPMWAVTGNPLRLSLPEQVLASAYVLMGVAYLFWMTWQVHVTTPLRAAGRGPAVVQLSEAPRH